MGVCWAKVHLYEVELSILESVMFNFLLILPTSESGNFSPGLCSLDHLAFLKAQCKDLVQC